MNRLGALFGTFIGDAIAVGPHWEYNTMKLGWKYKDFSTYPTTKRSLYHNKRQAGEQTQYGDQMALLIKYLTEHDTFDIKAYRDLWIGFFKDYPHYKDHATKDSLKIYMQEDVTIGAHSKDFAGPAMKALLFIDNHSIEEVNTIMNVTHNYDQSLEHLKLMKMLYRNAIQGIKPSEALKDYTGPEDLRTYLLNAKKLLDKDAIRAVKKLGQSCSTRSAFPATFYLLLKFEDNFIMALTENVKCGGDQAARGIFLGLILGALHGFDAIPKRWVDELANKTLIENYVQKIDQK